jgi:hypothetical protein
MLIESGQKSLQSVVENASEFTALCNDTLVSRRKTFHESEIGFSRPNDITNSDLLGWLSKTKSASAASNGSQIAGSRQCIDDLVEMSA